MSRLFSYFVNVIYIYLCVVLGIKSTRIFNNIKTKKVYTITIIYIYIYIYIYI